MPRLSEWLLKLMNIRREEARQVFLMIGFSFFTGLTLTFYFTASNAIFLKEFPARAIPLSFIASGVLIYLAWRIFALFDRRVSFATQVKSKFLFIFITVLAISIGTWFFKSPWLIFMMYSWVRIVVFITLVNFWGMAGKLFNIRQGKRIYGLISTGEVISIIIGYFSIPLLLQFVRTPELLFMASGSLLICVILVFYILRVFKKELSAAPAPAAKSNPVARSEWSYWNLVRKPYFMLISLMALLPIFGYLFIDYLFLTQTKREFANNTETIAQFLGIFLGFVAIIELLFKLTSGRFLNKYGLKPSLLSLPVILLLSIFLAAFFGLIYGTTGLFFAFIAMARLFERSMRGAVYEPAFQLLYQPVPPEQRLPFQNQIEGIPKAFGTLITGAFIWMLSGITAFTLVHFNLIFLLILGAWIWVSAKMYNAYRNTLRQKLVELKSPEQQNTDPHLEFMQRTLKETDDDTFVKLVSFFEYTNPVKTALVLENIWLNGSLRTRKIILRAVRQLGFGQMAGFLQKVGRDEAGGELGPAIASTLSEITRADELSMEEITAKARAADREQRLEAARLLGSSGRYNSYKLLIGLMKDSDTEVKKVAIQSSGKLRRFELWPLILENLTDPECFGAASRAVRIIGEPVLRDLDRFFDKVNDHQSVQLAILRMFESIGGPAAIRMLRDKINHPSGEVRFQVMLSLSNLEYRATPSESPYIKQALEDSVSTFVWLVASQNDLREQEGRELIQQALQVEIEEKKEQVLLLLSLLYDAGTIRHIRENIEGKDNNARIYALEISDMMIGDDVKELFFPIFEDLSVHERLNRFRERFPQQRLSVFNRCKEIVNKDFTRVGRWTKACAIDLAAGTLQPADKMEMKSLLAAFVVHPDPLLSELSGWWLHQIDKSYYLDTLVRFRRDKAGQLGALNNRILACERGEYTLRFKKILAMKENILLSPLPESKLAALLPPDTDSPLQGKNGSAIGEISIRTSMGERIDISIEKLQEIIQGDMAFMQHFILEFFKSDTKKDYA